MAAQMLRMGFRRNAQYASSIVCPFQHNLLCPPPAAITAVPRASISPWEEDKKAGYRKKIKRTTREMLKDGFGMIPEELQKIKNEVKGKLVSDSLYFVNHNDYEKVWNFDNNEEVNKWIVTQDRDNDEGKSQAEFILGQNKKGVFRGYINTKTPDDGVTKESGYCNIKSPPFFQSFNRETKVDWSDYTHLLVKCRGDGRPYHLSLKVERYFDVNWNDQFEYPLFTRGGPYWQISYIPFSKFFFTSKGRVQDRDQCAIDLHNVIGLGVTLADDCMGPFQLEIDFIGVSFDQTHKQKFAYEMYETPAEHTY